MKVKTIFNATLGISVEVFYTLVIMLAALVICLALTF